MVYIGICWTPLVFISNELNPGNASISLLLVKMLRIAFLLTFVVVCQDWGREGGWWWFKLILAMPVFWHHFYIHPSLREAVKNENVKFTQYHISQQLKSSGGILLYNVHNVHWMTYPLEAASTECHIHWMPYSLDANIVSTGGQK